jgi:hypothetical protein
MNPLTSSLPALQFAIELAQMTDQELGGASERVRQFVFVPDWVEGRASRPTEETLRTIQSATRSLLASVVKSGFAMARLQLVVVVARPELVPPSRKDARVMTSVDASPLLDRFLYRVIRLLEEIGIEKLQVCRAPQAGRDDAICGRMFMRVTRKEFCSARCQSRAYMRTYVVAGNAKRKGRRNGKTPRQR